MKSVLNFLNLKKNNSFFSIQSRFLKKIFKENSITLMKFKNVHIINIIAEINLIKVYMISPIAIT
jgi:hypothetical protein